MRTISKGVKSLNQSSSKKRKFRKRRKIKIKFSVHIGMNHPGKVEITNHKLNPISEGVQKKFKK